MEKTWLARRAKTALNRSRARARRPPTRTTVSSDVFYPFGECFSRPPLSSACANMSRKLTDNGSDAAERRRAVALRMFAGRGVNAVTARHAGRPRAEAGRPFAPASGLEWRRDARSHRPQSRRHADGGAREPTPACKPDARMQVKQAVAQTPPRQGGVRPHGGACASSKIPIQSHRILL